MANLRNIIILSLLLCSGLTHSQGFVDPQTPSAVKPMNGNLSGEWILDFSDEFNGSEVDTSKWNIDDSPNSRTSRPSIGVSSWFWRPQNVDVKDGDLRLKVTKESSSKMHCGSVNSNQKYLTTYGYFEVRTKIGDINKGTHSAFWLQGPNMSNVDGTANDGAEIDVFESAWTGEYTKSVVHIDGYGVDRKANTKQYSTPGIHSGFHVWGFYWTELFMNIYYDGVLKVQYTDDKWIVKSPEYLWLSNGASFGVEGDQFFVNQPLGYLTETDIDYIRVWKPKSSISTSSSIFYYDKWSNSLFFRTDKNVIQVEVFDYLGRRISDLLNLHLDRNQIDFNHIPPDTYLAKVTFRDGSFTTHKFIK